MGHQSGKCEFLAKSRKEKGGKKKKKKLQNSRFNEEKVTEKKKATTPLPPSPSSLGPNIARRGKKRFPQKRRETDQKYNSFIGS